MSEPEDFRVWKIRPDLLHAAGVCGGLVLVGLIAAAGLALHVAFIRAVVP